VRKLPSLPTIEKARVPKTEIRPIQPPTPFASMPQGPELYQQRKNNVSDFPGEPPDGFLDPTIHGSRSEWPIYAALWKYFDDQPDDGYLRPPFLGSPTGIWIYQSWQLGGRSTTGGAVADFEILSGRQGQSLILRIQSDRFHLTAGPRIVSGDDLQRERLSGDHRIVDLYETDFLHLRGSNLVRYIADVLAGRQIVNPISAGSYYRPRG
jgi:hypothetical protein